MEKTRRVARAILVNIIAGLQNTQHSTPNIEGPARSAEGLGYSRLRVECFLSLGVLDQALRPRLDKAEVRLELWLPELAFRAPTPS